MTLECHVAIYEVVLHGHCGKRNVIGIAIVRSNSSPVQWSSAPITDNGRYTIATVVLGSVHSDQAIGGAREGPERGHSYTYTGVTNGTNNNLRVQVGAVPLQVPLAPQVLVISTSSQIV